jgi:hypothetical protein
MTGHLGTSVCRFELSRPRGQLASRTFRLIAASAVLGRISCQLLVSALLYLRTARGANTATMTATQIRV